MLKTLIDEHLGDVLTGLIMLIVLIVTLIVQGRLHRSAMKLQREQFQTQIEAAEALSLRQLKSESDSRRIQNILKAENRVLGAVLDMEKVVSTGTGHEAFGEYRYHGFAAIRAMKSNVDAETREEFKVVPDLYDEVAELLKKQGNSLNGVPNKSEWIADLAGNFLGLLEAWVEAYADEDSMARTEIFGKMQTSVEALRSINAQ